MVHKPHDLVMNSEDPERASLYSILSRQESHLAENDKYLVSMSTNSPTVPRSWGSNSCALVRVRMTEVIYYIVQKFILMLQNVRTVALAALLVHGPSRIRL